jgi:hypothetical protein
MPTPSPRQGFVMNENFMGRNILPLVASVLGLIGLIFLGILVVPYMSDLVRIALMFVISGAIGELGYFLNKKSSSVLTRALIGTGVGGVFISILVTHLYFHAINDITAFALLAVWIIASMWLAKHTNSLLISILAHAGMMGSIALAYIGQVSDDQLILVVVYQIIATLAIILGNIFWVKKTYRFGLFASQGMILISLITMSIRLMPGTEIQSMFPEGLIVTTFFIQFLGGTALAYFIFVSCARVKDETLTVVLTSANILMWAGILVAGVIRVINSLAIAHMDADIWSNSGELPLAYIVGLAIVVGVTFVVSMMGSKLSMRKSFDYSAIASLAILMGVLMATRYTQFSIWNGAQYSPEILWFIIPAGVFILLARGFKSEGYTWAGRVFLAIDTVFMVLRGYGKLSESWTLWASVGYLILSVGLSYLSTKQVSDAAAHKHRSDFIVMRFLGATVSLMSITITADIGYGGGLFMIVVAAMLAALHFFGKPGHQLFYRISELTLAILTAFGLYQVGSNLSLRKVCPECDLTSSNIDIILLSAAAIILIAIFLDRARLAARKTSAALRTHKEVDTNVELLSGIGFNFAAVGICLPWFLPAVSSYWGFPVSLTCMVVSLIIVGLGLWSRVKTLRLYGLVVVIICVLKMVTLDIGSVTSIMRVIALLGGAAICFGISALYNYTAKYFDKELAQEIPDDTPVPVQVGVSDSPSPLSPSQGGRT